MGPSWSWATQKKNSVKNRFCEEPVLYEILIFLVSISLLCKILASYTVGPTSILTLDFRSYLAYSPFKTVIFVKLVMSYFDFFSLKIQPLFNRETTQCGFLDLCWPLDFPQINRDIYGRHTHTQNSRERQSSSWVLWMWTRLWQQHRTKHRNLFSTNLPTHEWSPGCLILTESVLFSLLESFPGLNSHVRDIIALFRAETL